MRAEFFYPMLVASGFVAGFVDSIAGGGGLISLPVFLLTGMPTVEASATNKLAATFGSFTSSARYLKARQVEPIAWAMAGVAFFGSIAGASLATLLKSDQLKWIISVALIAVGCYVALRKDFGKSRRLRGHHWIEILSAFGLALAIGFYDGLIGPGTGTFLAFVFITVLGLDFLKATGSTKLVNFSTNLAALLTYLWRGVPIHYFAGVTMGIAILAGAYTGSGMAVRIGPRFIRPLFIMVAVALAIKLVLDFLRR